MVRQLKDLFFYVVWNVHCLLYRNKNLLKDENVLIYGRWIFSLNLMDLNTKIHSDKPFAFHAYILKDKSPKELLLYTVELSFHPNSTGTSQKKKNPVKRGNYGSWFDVKLNENERCLCVYIGMHIYIYIYTHSTIYVYT